MPAPASNRALLIGWDAAEWRVIRPLVDRGWMPNLASLIHRGVSGPLTASPPLLSPTLWTTLATGQHATRHGVLGSLELTPDGADVRPLGRHACKVEPFWSILRRANAPSHVINFPGTHPADDTGGVSVSNLFPVAVENRDDDLDAVCPPKLVDELRPLRVRETDIDAASILSFVPRAAEIDRTRDLRLAFLAQILAHTATVHAIVTWAMEHMPWSMTGVCYTGLHQFSHGFMAYHPPRRPHINERDFDLYHGVVTAAYRFHDMMLGRLLQLAGADTHVLLVSDHGFHSDHLRPLGSGAAEEAMLAWHRPHGVAIAAGPTIESRGQLHGAALTDVAPTILGLLGQPAPREMRGHAWFGVARDQSPRPPLPPPSPRRSQPTTSDEPSPAVRFLLSLGYLEREDPHAKLSAAHMENSSRFYLAVAHLDARQPAQALPLLQRLVTERPGVIEYQIALAHAYAGLRRLGDARAIVDRLLARFPGAPEVLAAAGMLDLASRRTTDALRRLREADSAGLRSPLIFTTIGRAYLRLAMHTDARRAFERCLALDPEQPDAHAGLAAALLALGDAGTAATAARAAIDLAPTQPEPHYRLAGALLAKNEFATARDHLLDAVKVDAEYLPALRKLAWVCDRLGDRESAKRYDREAHLALLNRRLSSRASAAGTARPVPS